MNRRADALNARVRQLREEMPRERASRSERSRRTRFRPAGERPGPDPRWAAEATLGLALQALLVDRCRPPGREQLRIVRLPVGTAPAAVLEVAAVVGVAAVAVVGVDQAGAKAERSRGAPRRTL